MDIVTKAKKVADNAFIISEQRKAVERARKRALWESLPADLKEFMLECKKAGLTFLEPILKNSKQ